jgi:DNA-binding transcriptional LysR family regulator
MMRASLSLENTLKGLEAKAEGEVKVWSNDGVLAYCIAPGLAEFLAANPGLRLSLQSDRNLPKQGQGYADVVVGFDQPHQADTISFPVATLHYCAFSSRSYLETYGTPSGPLDIAQHRVLNHMMYGENPGWKDKTAQIASLIEPTILTDCSAALLEATAAGAGIAVMPSYAARLDPRLVALPLPPLASVKVWLSFHESARRTPRVRTVVTWMRELFDRRRNPWFREEYVPPSLFETAAWQDERAA